MFRGWTPLYRSWAYPAVPGDARQGDGSSCPVIPRDAIVAVRRREIASTRLILPGLLLAAALLVANHLIPKPLAVAGLLAIDVLFLIFCLRLARAMRTPEACSEMPEQRLQRVLVQFFPAAFAAFVSADVTVLSHAFAGLKTFVDVAHGSPRSYVKGSKIVIAAVAIGAAIVPDAVFFWLLIPHRAWWVAGGVPLLRIDLASPALEHHALLSKPREVTRIYVASDEPDALRSELWQLCAGTSRAARA